MEVFVGFSTKTTNQRCVQRSLEKPNRAGSLQDRNGEVLLSDAPDAGEFLVLY